MIPALRNRNFGWGGGIINPTRSTFVLNIPKNASSYVSAWCNSLGWTTAEVGDCSNWNHVREVAVVLRDPVDRWLSGIAQYINTYILSVRGPNGPIFPGDPYDPELDRPISAQGFIEQYNMLAERLIFDIINRFDDHVWPQAELCDGVLPEVPRRYFMLDSEFDHKFASYIGSEPPADLDRNSSEDNANMCVLREFFKQRLLLRPELKNRVIRAYAEDYALIERVKNEMV